MNSKWRSKNIRKSVKRFLHNNIFCLFHLSFILFLQKMTYVFEIEVLNLNNALSAIYAKRMKEFPPLRLEYKIMHHWGQLFVPKGIDLELPVRSIPLPNLRYIHKKDITIILASNRSRFAGETTVLFYTKLNTYIYVLLRT